MSARQDIISKVKYVIKAMQCSLFIGLISLFALTWTTAIAVSPENSDGIRDGYSPEVQELLETTYLGHAANLPDPGEPAAVLAKYLATNNHKASEVEDINQLITEWEALTKEFPTSRHAFLGLAKAYERSGQLESALSSYREASAIALEHDRILYTREISELCVTLNDKSQLDQAFGQILSIQQDKDYKNYYLALVDYADGLAKLNDYKRAFVIFDRAVKEYPERNIEAINRYANHLAKQGMWQKLLEVVNTLTEDQRVWEVSPAYYRKIALKKLGLDTSSADNEIQKVELNLSAPGKGSEFGTVVIRSASQSEGAATSSLGN